ncbi:MAG: hypothetical protein MZV64_59190 [Ignavibacteriales bacterium]|nr:hypothetical protein [Ignavibacteriales bacterium]
MVSTGTMRSPPADVSREIASLYGDQFLNPPSTPMLIIDRKGVAHPLPVWHQERGRIVTKRSSRSWTRRCKYLTDDRSTERRIHSAAVCGLPSKVILWKPSSPHSRSACLPRPVPVFCRCIPAFLPISAAGRKECRTRLAAIFSASLSWLAC